MSVYLHRRFFNSFSKTAKTVPYSKAVIGMTMKMVNTARSRVGAGLLLSLILLSLAWGPSLVIAESVSDDPVVADDATAAKEEEATTTGATKGERKSLPWLTSLLHRFGLQAAKEENDDSCVEPSVLSEEDAKSSVYVIGDIHGDVICAISWVNRTGLIQNLLNDNDVDDSATVYDKLNNPTEWKWNNEQASLVFMGDYVDKGPTSKQTVEFVKNLTDVFPNKVTAILGNHELELLRDRDSRMAPYQRYSSYTHAVVHPGEYHNYLDDVRSLDEKDDIVLDQMYEALMEVYAFRAHSAVRMVPELNSVGNKHRHYGIQYAITDIIDPKHRELAKERLEEYQDAYLKAFRSGTKLGDFVENRPIVHLDENLKTLFVHGGVSEEIGTRYFAKGKEGVDRINKVWFEHSHEGKIYDFLSGRGIEVDDELGYVVYELLTYRGNHPGYANWESSEEYDDSESDMHEVCATLHKMLSKMEGIDRIAVGHTPEWNVQVRCDGAFLALDSTLGRWIRGTGNEYCPGPEHFEKRKGEGVDVARTSRDSRYRCHEIKKQCEGSIVRLDSDMSVNILRMES